MAEEPPTSGTREQIEGLIRENRTLGETLASLQKELESLQNSLQQAVQARQSAEEEAEQLRQGYEQLQKTVAELQSSKDQLEAQVGRLSLQVESTPLQPLTTKEASTLFNRTLQELSNVSGFEVRNAELTLKLATAKLGEEPVLVLPQPDAVDPATLHELTFSFRSGASLSETS
jgi:chromosome segregation ATPase